MTALINMLQMKVKMRLSNHKAIRELLHQNPDGLMVSEIAKALGVKNDSIKVALRSMVDTYIDRWVRLRGSPIAAVWCAVEVPANCPKPENKNGRNARSKS